MGDSTIVRHNAYNCTHCTYNCARCTYNCATNYTLVRTIISLYAQLFADCTVVRTNVRTIEESIVRTTLHNCTCSADELGRDRAVCACHTAPAGDDELNKAAELERDGRHIPVHLGVTAALATITSGIKSWDF